MHDWDDFRLILALSRAGTLRATAGALGINHATVSRRLAAINRQHPAPLFERVAGGYRPTETGHAAINAAENMEMLTLTADRKMRAEAGEMSGDIRLSVPQALAQYILLEPLAAFALDHPGINLSIETSYQFANLDRSEADIVIRSCEMPPEHLVGRQLFPYALCHYCSREYRDSVRPQDRTWLARSHDQQALDWIADSPFPNAPISHVIDDISLLHSAARAGQGMMRNGCYIGDSDPDMVRLSEPFIMPKTDFWVLTHPDLRDTPRIRGLMRFLVQILIDRRDLIQGR